MNGSYSYRGLATEDLLAAQELLKAKLYNHAVRLCQQYVEKVLKQCLFTHGTDEADLYLLHTHKIVRLAERCAQLCNIEFTFDEIAFFRELSDYYFDTNYPGENYIRVSESKANEVYNSIMNFKNKYESKLC